MVKENLEKSGKTNLDISQTDLIPPTGAVIRRQLLELVWSTPELPTAYEGLHAGVSLRFLLLQKWDFSQYSLKPTNIKY